MDAASYDLGVGCANITCVEKPATIDALDELGYLAANPDVRKAGVAAREHFLHHGRQEGRLQWVNQDKVAELREQKLRSLRFRRDPAMCRAPGEAPNFISPEIIAEFAIPDAPPVSANQYGGPFIDEIRNHPQRLCLDVGAGLRYNCYGNVVNADIYPSISTDVVCVGEDLPFEDDQFDYATCLAVLEHTRRPWDVAREICRILKPGGKVLVDYPFMVGVHGYPHHYFNATPRGAVSLFEEFCDIQSSTIESNNHPMHALIWVLTAWRYGLDGADREKFEDLTVREILGRPAEAQLAEFYCKNLGEEAQRAIPAGSTVIAIKKAASMLVRGPDEAVDLRQRVQALERELAAVRTSRSWRVTAPLRALRRAATG